MSGERDVLAEICAAKREEVAELKAGMPLADVMARAKDQPPCRGFAAALRRTAEAERLALIAEIKKASPSKGLIRADFDPASLALAYRAGGASCLSVLTERRWFQGDPEHLAAARTASGLPALRKDFILEPWQVYETRALGGDCLLLIVAALEDAQATELGGLALELGLDVLVEVHDRAEMERALGLPATMIGINNRNLKTLKVDLQTTVELAPLVPDDRLLVAESGLGSHADLLAMQAVGAQAFLVGESLMRQPDLEAATRTLLGLAST